MKIKDKLQKSLSYILLPVMILFTFQSAFANNYECQITNYDKPHSLTINNSQLTINDNPFKYSGYYSDAESGLYYLKARYYSPELMRFINRDTYDLSNRYAYCNGDPISSTDPSGHMPKWFKVGLGITTFLAGAAGAWFTGGASFAGACGILGGLGVMGSGVTQVWSNYESGNTKATLNKVAFWTGVAGGVLSLGAGAAKYFASRAASRAAARVGVIYSIPKGVGGEEIELTESVDFSSMSKTEIEDHLIEHGTLKGEGDYAKVYLYENKMYKCFKRAFMYGDKTQAEEGSEIINSLTCNRNAGFAAEVVGINRDILVTPFAEGVGTASAEEVKALHEFCEIHDRRDIIDLVDPEDSRNMGYYGPARQPVVFDVDLAFKMDDDPGA